MFYLFHNYWKNMIFTSWKFRLVIAWIAHRIDGRGGILTRYFRPSFCVSDNLRNCPSVRSSMILVLARNKKTKQRSNFQLSDRRTTWPVTSNWHNFIRVGYVSPRVKFLNAIVTAICIHYHPCVTWVIVYANEVRSGMWHRGDSVCKWGQISFNLIWGVRSGIPRSGQNDPDPHSSTW